MISRRLLKHLDTIRGRLTLAALLLTLFAAPAHAQSTPTSGYLEWGVKQSFRSYIKSNIARGTITPSAGATQLGDNGVFRFPLTGDEFDRQARTGIIRAGGSVHFSGHSGLLDMTITNPRVVVGATSSTLYADVRSKALDGAAEMKDYPNVAFATLAGGAPADVTAPVVFGAWDAKLTAAGVPAFANFYPEDTALDPLSISVTAWGVTPDPTTTPDPSVTPDPTTTPDPTSSPTPTATAVPLAATPTPAPQPTVEAPAVERVAARQTISRSGVLRFAALTCGSASCTISRPKTVKLKIGGRTYTARVTGPTKLAAGRAGELRLRLTKAAVRALGRRTVKARMTVTVTAGGGQQVKQTISTSFKLRKG